MLVDHATLQRLVRQHAQTSRLLGVDFVPAYGPGGVVVKAEHVAEASTAAVAIAAAPTAAVPPALVAPVPAKPVVVMAPPSPRDAKAREAAMAALRARYESDAPHSKFVTAHSQIVWGDGSLTSRLVFVGEAPGEEEDKQGKPFVGRSGQLLEKMIRAMGLTRETVYICNVLKTRPPNNATPTGREIELCEPYLREQVAILAPEAIVTLGLPASRALLHSDESMTKMRGRWRLYALPDGREVPLMPTFHPAYLLRNYTAEARAQVWSDLKQVMEKLGLEPPAATPGTSP